MKLVKIGNYAVVEGMSVKEYAKLVGLNKSNIDTYDQLCATLEEMCENNGGSDPLWDYPLEEMKEGQPEDKEHLYVELFGHYFETLIPLEDALKVLDNYVKEDPLDKFCQNEAIYRLTDFFGFSKDKISKDLQDDIADVIHKVIDDCTQLYDQMDEAINEYLEENGISPDDDEE